MHTWRQKHKTIINYTSIIGLIWREWCGTMWSVGKKGTAARINFILLVFYTRALDPPPLTADQMASLPLFLSVGLRWLHLHICMSLCRLSLLIFSLLLMCVCVFFVSFYLCVAFSLFVYLSLCLSILVYRSVCISVCMDFSPFILLTPSFLDQWRRGGNCCN